MTAVIVPIVLLALIVGFEWHANRRVRLENERLDREYQLAREDARRNKTMPPVPPNRLMRR